MTDTKTNNRLQQLHDWLQHVFVGHVFDLDSLPGDASARQYHRLHLPQDDGTALRYIVMDSSDEQAAMRQFINVATLMAPAVNVPAIVAQDVTKGFLVLQDFGTVEFAHLLVDATPTQIDEYYQRAMHSLIALQKVPVDTAKTQHQLPDYEASLLEREMDLFADWFVPYIGIEQDAAAWRGLKAALIQEILQQPQVVVHRDYHSRNLMQDQANPSSLGVIDFQDAVVGSYVYDLVSLVRDAYVEWNEHQISGWIGTFWQLQQQAGLTTAHSVEQLEYDVHVMGVQRHLKVVGIFIRLSKRDGKDRYLADIPKVMRDLCFELTWLAAHGSTELQQALRPFNRWFEQRVWPAYQRTFDQ